MYVCYRVDLPLSLFLSLSLALLYLCADVCFFVCSENYTSVKKTTCMQPLPPTPHLYNTYKRDRLTLPGAVRFASLPCLPWKEVLKSWVLEGLSKEKQNVGGVYWRVF